MKFIPLPKRGKKEVKKVERTLMFIQKIIEVKGVWKSTKDLISHDIQDICNLYAELLDPVFENTEAIKVTNFGHQLTLDISANEIKVFKFDGTQEKSIFVGYRKMKDIKNLYEFLQVLRNETEMSSHLDVFKILLLQEL